MHTKNKAQEQEQERRNTITTQKLTNKITS